MTPERHAIAREVFLEAVSRPAGKRTAYLVEMCGEDTELRAEVESLLAHHTDEDAPSGIAAAPGIPSPRLLEPQEDVRPRVSTPVRDGVAQSSDLEFVAGQMISDRYRIQVKVGEGGNGVVYRAQDVVLNQTVAIKFLAGKTLNSTDLLERFRSEVRMALRVSHPNVCRVFDIGDANGRAYLTMEFCDGEDLARLIRRAGRLSQEKGCDIARQICIGLAAAHGAGILHLDLKPANILLDAQGKVLITDFGIAAATNAAGIRDTAGTPGYMAPEQIIGVGVDERSDIYSLGLVLYELFSGRPAFNEKSVIAYLESQITSQPTPISEVIPGIDRDIESLIDKCISKDRDQRPSSALAVASALPGVDALQVALEARQTAPPSLVGNATDLANRLNRPGAWVAAAIIGCLVLPVIRQWSGFPWDASDSSPPPVLLDAARSVVRAVHPEGQLRDSSYGYCDRYRARLIMEQFVGPLPPGYAIGPRRGLFFWYRVSASPLDPITVETLIFGPGHTTSIDPPFAGSEQLLVLLDDRGRLLELARKEWDAELRPSKEALPAMMEAAQLKEVDSQPAQLSWSHRSAQRTCEIRNATLADSHPALQFSCDLRESLFVYFVMEPEQPAVASITFLSAQFRATFVRNSLRFLYIVATLLAIPLAMRNLRLSRTDTHGASRLFTFFFLASIAGWILRASHGRTVYAEIGLVSVAVLRALGVAAMAMILYLALEPLARKYWPHLMIVWTRLLQARPVSTVFWHHILVGIAAGCMLPVVLAANYAAVRSLWGVRAEPLFTQQVGQRIAGLGSILAGVCASMMAAVGESLLLTLLLVGARWALGSVRLAILAVGVLYLAVVLPRGTGADFPSLILGIVGVGLSLWVTIRFGLLSLAVLYFVSDVLHCTPMTLRPENWYFPISAVALGGFAAIAVYAYIQTRRDAAPSSFPQTTGGPSIGRNQ